MWSSSIPSRSSAKPEVSPKRAIFSSDLLATNLPLLPRLLQLSVALRMDLLLPAGEDVVRGEVACGGVQPDIVVTLDVAGQWTRSLSSRASDFCLCRGVQPGRQVGGDRVWGRHRARVRGGQWTRSLSPR